MIKILKNTYQLKNPKSVDVFRPRSAKIALHLAHRLVEQPGIVRHEIARAALFAQRKSGKKMTRKIFMEILQAEIARKKCYYRDSDDYDLDKMTIAQEVIHLQVILLKEGKVK